MHHAQGQGVVAVQAGSEVHTTLGAGRHALVGDADVLLGLLVDVVATER